MLQPSTLESPSGPPPRAGYRLLLAIFTRPAEAFALVALTRQWLPAYLVIVALGLAEQYLSAPAMTHMLVTLAHASHGVTAGDISRGLALQFEFNVLWSFVGPFVVWTFVGMLLTAVAITSRGGGVTGFSTYFSLCMNCAVPAEIGQLLLYAATRLRDPSTFRASNDLLTALPFSLAALRPHGSAPEIAFLSYWNAFALWSLVLLGCGYATLAKMPLVPALLLVLGVGLSLALTQVGSP